MIATGDRAFAGGIDRGRAIDPNTVARAIGDPRADHEIERRRTPHAIGYAHLRQRIEIEAGGTDMRGAALALDRQFDW